jgi:uncharacterized membrane protein
MLYLWLKAFHIAAAATWIGGLIIAALAVTAAFRPTEASSEGDRRWLNTVRGWDRRVTSPAMMIVWGLGLTLGLQGGWFASSWLWAKLVVVVGLSALHGQLSGTLRRAAREAGQPSVAARANAAPAVVAAVAVIAVLAVTKPF